MPVKEHSVGGAKVVLVEAGGRIKITVALTSAPAETVIRTLTAGRIELQGSLDKAQRKAVFVNDVKAMLIEIAQFIFVQNEKVAGVDTAVSFHHMLDTAYPVLIAGFRGKAGSNTHIVFELADIGLPVLFQIGKPERKQTAQEITVKLWCQCVGFLLMAFVQRIKAHDVLLIVPFLLFVVSIHFFDPTGNISGYYSKNVEVNTVLCQQVNGLEDARICFFAGPGVPVCIMDIRGAVHRDTNQKVVCLKKTAPGVINDVAIGLKGVVDRNVVDIVLALVVNDLFKEIHTLEQGLAALKRIGDGTDSMGKCFSNDIFQSVFRHEPIGTVLPLLGFVTVEAVVTGHVAQAGSWLD